jgi:hypothetical protein
MKQLLPLLFVLFGCDTSGPAREVSEPEIKVVYKDRIVPSKCADEGPPEPAVPEGFPAEDEFADDAAAAADEMAARYVCPDKRLSKNPARCRNENQEFMRGQIVRYWKYRIKVASNGGKYRSKVDGTSIHDRDRHAGAPMYDRLVRKGALKPDVCAWHQIDPNVGHRAIERSWVADWPFTASPIPLPKLKSWMRTDHDKERFAARGAADMSVYIWGFYFHDRCFDPAQLDRNDVNFAVFAEWALEQCGRARAEGVVCTRTYLHCRFSGKARRRSSKCRRLKAEIASKATGKD